MFKRKSIGWAIWNAIEAVLLFVSGILCMVWSGNTDFQRAAVLVAGIIVIVDAGLRLLLGVIEIVTTDDYSIVKTNTSQAIASAAELSLGIGLCYVFANYAGNPAEGISPAKDVFGYIGIYIGVALIVIASLVVIHGAVFAIRKAYSIPRNLATIFSGLVVMVLGIVSLVNLNPSKGDNVVRFFLFVFGLAITAIGVAVFLGSLFAIVAAKRLNTAEEEIQEEQENRKTPIEAEVEEKPASESEQKPEPEPDQKPEEE